MRDSVLFLDYSNGFICDRSIESIGGHPVHYVSSWQQVGRALLHSPDKWGAVVVDPVLYGVDSSHFVENYEMFCDVLSDFRKVFHVPVVVFTSGPRSDPFHVRGLQHEVHYDIYSERKHDSDNLEADVLKAFVLGRNL